MDLEWYEVVLLTVFNFLSNLCTWVSKTSVWRFYRTHLAPLEGLPGASKMRRAKRPTPSRSRGRALTLPLPSPRDLPGHFPGSPGRVVTGFEPWSWVLFATRRQRVAADQTRSGFLTRLPQDIRVIVYEMVLGGKGFHISQTTAPVECYGICDAHSLMLGAAWRHGSCHVKRKKDLLPFLFTCRQVYSEAIYVLYAANAFEFTQQFCLVKFVKALPGHRLSSIRRLRYFLHLSTDPTLNRRTRSDWEDVWRFFGSMFEGLTVLRVDLGMGFVIAQRICGESEDEAEWLMPIVRIRGRYEGGKSHVSEQRRLFVGVPGTRHGTLVDVNEVRDRAKVRLEPGRGEAELEAVTCGNLHEQLQNSLRGWLAENALRIANLSHRR